MTRPCTPRKLKAYQDMYLEEQEKAKQLLDALNEVLFTVEAQVKNIDGELESALTIGYDTIERVTK